MGEFFIVGPNKTNVNNNGNGNNTDDDDDEKEDDDGGKQNPRIDKTR